MTGLQRSVAVRDSDHSTFPFKEIVPVTQMLNPPTTPAAPRMSSAAVRDLMPESLPQVHLPACDPRKILKGQKALVTGANSGIGKAVAIALCKAGADVMINYRSGDEQAQAVIDEATHCGCSTN